MSTLKELPFDIDLSNKIAIITAGGGVLGGEFAKALAQCGAKTIILDLDGDKATDEKSIERLINLVDSPNNGLAICSGSLGANPENNVPNIIRKFGDRIHFGHVRNIKIIGKRSFEETAHLSSEGSLDLYQIMKAYYDIGFKGSIRPDHGRMIWNEEGKPGYGLYDRALGVSYLSGLWEAITKSEK